MNTDYTVSIASDYDSDESEADLNVKVRGRRNCAQCVEHIKTISRLEAQLKEVENNDPAMSRPKAGILDPEVAKKFGVST